MGRPKRAWVVTAVLLAGLGAGCGGDDDDSPKAPRPAGDEAGLRELAEEYLGAVTSGDWEVACRTRSEREQRDLARQAGSCAKAFEAILEGRPRRLFEGAEATDVRIRGDVAGIDVEQPGQSEPVTTLAAVRDESAGGAWKLEDVSDEKTP